jgi:hypothetical protein
MHQTGGTSCAPCAPCLSLCPAQASRPDIALHSAWQAAICVDKPHMDLKIVLSAKALSSISSSWCVWLMSL